MGGYLFYLVLLGEELIASLFAYLRDLFRPYAPAFLGYTVSVFVDCLAYLLRQDNSLPAFPVYELQEDSEIIIGLDCLNNPCRLR
jgi:hypothetical protein